MNYEDYLHLVDPARPYSFSGAIIGLCGYQWAPPTTEAAPALSLDELNNMRLCEVCSIIAHTVASIRGVSA